MGIGCLRGAALACLSLSVLAGALPGDREIFARLYGETLITEKDFYRPDPLTGILHRPLMHIKVAWPEHANGAFEINTNSMGFREDAPTAALKKPGTFRILITGDSHTDGLVNNSESFPKLIEDALNRGREPGGYETINAGVGHFSFRNYLGLLKRYRFLKPDVFIATVYSGNDFLEAAEYLESGEPAAAPKPYAARLAEADKRDEGAVWQALNQVVYFKSFPEMTPRVMTLAQDTLREMRDLCRKDGIRFLVILLPTKLDVEWGSDRQKLDGVKSYLNLSDADLRLNANMSAAVGRWMKTEGIPFLDLAQTPPRARRAPLFWNQDYHLSAEGHRWIAEAVLQARSGLLLRRPAGP